MKFPKIFKIMLMVLMSMKARAELVITLGGDINFNKTSFHAHEEGFSPSNSRRGEDLVPWGYFTEKLEPLLTGDLNFANIETVVTDDNSIIEETKRFKFKTHPNAFLHLVDIGFNFFSIANNHAYDLKYQGMEETLKNLKSVSQQTPIYYHGIGKRAELLKPKQFEVKGYRIAFAAISIVEGNYAAKNNQIGMLDIRSKEDYHDLIVAFKKTSADLKILSIHYGIEGKVTLDEKQKKYYEYAIDQGDVDLIIGHHPHAVRPISLYKNKLIFYSLGNYLMLGSADITKKGGGADWGMFAKVVYTKKQRAQVDAVEFQMLTRTHSQVSPLVVPKIAKSRFREYASLNDNQLGEDVLPWVMNSDFKGVYCPEVLTEKTSMDICNVK